MGEHIIDENCMFITFVLWCCRSPYVRIHVLVVSPLMPESFDHTHPNLLPFQNHWPFFPLSVSTELSFDSRLLSTLKLRRSYLCKV